MIRFRSLLLLATISVSVMPALADSFTIGPVCGTCQGSIYTLSVTFLESDIWEAKLTIDTSGYNGNGVAIDAVAVKISSAVREAKLVNAPGGADSWSLVPGGINADGCSDEGSGFECAEWAATGGSGISVSNGSLIWIFHLTTNALAGEYSIKARYVDAKGNKVGDLVSEPIPVPEPGTLILLAAGVLAVYPVARRSSGKR